MQPFSRQPRREIGKQHKIYFLDLGVRSAPIGDFNAPILRADRGALWENFLIVERLKTWCNQGLTVQNRFWRTYSGAEVDYIEEAGAGDLRAYELKWGNARLGRSAESFKDSYGVGVTLVNQENYLDFLLPG